jgi:hypothetical protein
LQTCDFDDEGSCLRELTFCEALELRTFLSVDELECGLGPGGVELCNWRVELRGGRYEWGHSDVAESGTYTCTGSVVTADMYVGTWDDDREIFVWDGVDYEMAPAACPD